MPIIVKNIVLWRREAEDKPGILASTLEPFAAGGADLQVVMGYRFPGKEKRAAIELYPVAGRALTKAAQGAGLEASAIPTLLAQGDNRPGLGHQIAQAVSEAGINLTFLIAQVVGRRTRAFALPPALGVLSAGILCFYLVGGWPLCAAGTCRMNMIAPPAMEMRAGLAGASVVRSVRRWSPSALRYAASPF